MNKRLFAGLEELRSKVAVRHNITWQESFMGIKRLLNGIKRLENRDMLVHNLWSGPCMNMAKEFQ